MENRNKIGVAIRLRPLLNDEIAQGHHNSNISFNHNDKSIM